MWPVKQTDDFERSRKWYAKKRPYELAAVMDNAESYEKALAAGANPLQIRQFGYVHDERRGVYAVDQSHARVKRKLAETRLYLYPETETQTLFYLQIGDKGEQSRHVRDCHEFVDQRRRELENESNERNIQERKGSSPSQGDS